MSVDLAEFWAFALAFTRIVALIATAPVFSSRAVPRTTRVGLAALLAVALGPTVRQHGAEPPADLVGMLGQMAAEAAVGMFIGFLTRVVFSAFEAAGHFVDFQIGFGMMSVLNPFSDQAGAVVSRFLYQFGFTLFLVAGGHLVLIGTVAASYETVGPGAARFTGDSMGVVTAMATGMATLALRVALPIAASLLVVDAAFAIIARMVPQIHILIVGLPVKILVGLLTLALAVPGVAIVAGGVPENIASAAQAILRSAR
ncbi:MAG TPA: flagellar biosynthetic protein FliR [Chthonomonadales bacterium]|nr:flagellar biosynthetic protein FliR [Chthonomonadales bacterium]